MAKKSRAVLVFIALFFVLFNGTSVSEKLMEKQFEKQYGKAFMGEGLKGYFYVKNQMKIGRWATAYKKLRWLQKLYPSVCYIYEDLFISAYKLGKYKEAYFYYKQAKKYGSKNAELDDFVKCESNMKEYKK